MPVLFQFKVNRDCAFTSRRYSIELLLGPESYNIDFLLLRSISGDLPADNKANTISIPLVLILISPSKD